MASDIDVPTWVNVRWSVGLVVTVPVVVELLVSIAWRRKVGTLSAGAAKSVASLRLAAPTMRLAYCSKSAAERSWALALKPVPPVVPELEPREAVPPMVSKLPKSRIGPKGLGITPLTWSVGGDEARLVIRVGVHAGNRDHLVRAPPAATCRWSRRPKHCRRCCRR